MIIAEQITKGDLLKKEKKIKWNVFIYSQKENRSVLKMFAIHYYNQ